MMLYFDPYLELIGVYQYDRKRFFQLLTLCLIQRWSQFYIASILFIYTNLPIFLVFVIQSEIFFHLYLTNTLHWDWLKQTIEKSEHVTENEDKEAE